LQPYARRVVGAFCVALALALTSCDAGGDAGANGAAGTRRGGDFAGQPPVPVAVEAAMTGSISSFYTATATLEVEKEAQVLARVSGIVEKRHHEEGDDVPVDEPLLTIDNDEYRLRFEQAQARRVSLEAKYTRLLKVSKDLVSVDELEAAQNDLDTAKADEGLAKLQLSYTTVVAPFEGRIVQRFVDEGQNVTVGTPLFTVADFNPLLARVYVPAKQLGKLATEQAVDLVLDSIDPRSTEADTGPLKGTITEISPVIDPETGTIKVTIEIPDYPKNTRPGDFAEVRIVTEERASATLVSKTAVFTDKGERVAYVADTANGTAERRVVEVGFSDDDRTEIRDGIGPGDLVIVKGQRSLRHGSPIKILAGPGSPEGADDADGEVSSSTDSEKKSQDSL